MKYSTTCTGCGHQRTAYMHKLNKKLVASLRQLVDHYEETHTPANLQQHLVLDKNDYNNFQKLQYFGAVIRTPQGWVPTQYGTDFIHGTQKLWNRVITIESEVVSQDHEAWKTATKFPVAVSVHEVDHTKWKHREAYQAERSRQVTFAV